MGGGERRRNGFSRGRIWHGQLLCGTKKGKGGGGRKGSRSKTEEESGNCDKVAETERFVSQGRGPSQIKKKPIRQGARKKKKGHLLTEGKSDLG